MADEQNQPQIIGDGDPRIENDPEVLAEERRLRIKMLRLHYYRDLAKTFGVFLQTFKTEATSLVSGLGTLVLGYYQIKKWVLHGHQETKTVTANGRAMAGPARVNMEGGSGKLVVKKHRQPTSTIEVPRGEELVSGSPLMPEPSFMADPTFYLTILLGLVFSLTSGKMVFKRLRGNKEEKGGPNGPL